MLLSVLDLDLAACLDVDLDLPLGSDMGLSWAAGRCTVLLAGFGAGAAARDRDLEVLALLRLAVVDGNAAALPDFGVASSAGAGPLVGTGLAFDAWGFVREFLFFLGRGGACACFFPALLGVAGEPAT